MSKFLNEVGLSHFLAKVKTYCANTFLSKSGWNGEIGNFLTVNSGGNVGWATLPVQEPFSTIKTVARASGWSGESPQNKVSCPGLLASSNGLIGLGEDATEEQRFQARAAMLSVSTQENGYIVLIADGQPPDVDIPILIYYF